MKSFLSIFVLSAAFGTLLSSLLGCDGPSLTDTSTGSEVENGIAVLVKGDTVEVKTRANTAVVLADTGYQLHDTYDNIIRRQKNPGGVVEFQSIPSGGYNVIVTDSSAGEGAILKGLSVSANENKSYNFEFKELSTVSGIVTVVRTDSSYKLARGVIGLVGTPFAQVLHATGTSPDNKNLDTLRFTFTFDNIPSGTYNYALQLIPNPNCLVCGVGTELTITIPNHSVEVAPGRRVQDSVLYVKD